MSCKVLDPCPASMQANYALNIDQTCARAFEFTLQMKTLEYAEEPVVMIHVKPHSIVINEKDMFTSIHSKSYLDFDTRMGTCEFNGVKDEIDKH